MKNDMAVAFGRFLQTDVPQADALVILRLIAREHRVELDTHDSDIERLASDFAEKHLDAKVTLKYLRNLRRRRHRGEPWVRATMKETLPAARDSSR
jgi:hypothetical protein